MTDFNFPTFISQRLTVKRQLTSPEGQKLLQLLNQDGGKRLRQAADALKKGQQETAKKILAPVMETEEATRLVKKINRE